jgi:mono/diheme cytochrome c family protein
MTVRGLPSWSLRTRVLLAGVLCIAVTACVSEEGGYPKVTERQRGELPAHPAPDPPPLTAAARAGAAAPELAMPADLPEGVTAEMVQEGQRLYGTVCTACHGPGGAGTPAGPALNDQNWIHITGEFSEIENITRTGVMQPREYPGAMPPLGGGNFDDDQLRAISAYVYAISQAGS